MGACVEFVGGIPMAVQTVAVTDHPTVPRLEYILFGRVTLGGFYRFSQTHHDCRRQRLVSDGEMGEWPEFLLGFPLLI